MIYIYRFLWLIGYMPMFIISLFLFIIHVFIILPIASLFYYIKYGTLEEMSNSILLTWTLAIIYWYNDLEDKINNYDKRKNK